MIQLTPQKKSEILLTTDLIKFGFELVEKRVKDVVILGILHSGSAYLYLCQYPETKVLSY